VKTTKELLIEYIVYEIGKKQKQLSVLERLPINQLSEAFPNGVWTVSWADSFEFTLPLTFSLFDVVKDYMRDQQPDFKMARESQFVWDESQRAGHFLEYEATIDSARVRFQFGFRSHREGAQCVLQQIGTKVVPIFEVVCPEGAKEPL
jgi:hypothetical protein